MEILKNINIGLRFILELCLVAALSFSGFHLTSHAFLKWLFAVIMPLGAALVWGMLIAPKAAHLLDQPQRLVVEFLLFGTAAALLFTTGHKTAGILLAGSVLLNEVLLIIWKQ